MKELTVKGEYITLGQLLKAVDLVSDGAEAKIVIQEGDVLVDGSTETRRGRKLRGGEVVSFRGEEIRVRR